MTFCKWPKTFRILVPEIDVKGKHFLSDQDTKLLLAGEVSITQKYDGANTAIIRVKDGFRFQKRSGLVGTSEHPQFGALIAWGQINYNKLIQIPENTMLFGEWLYAKHSIFYNKLPDFFLAFAWYNFKDDTYYSRDEMTKLCDSLGLSYVSEVARGHFKRTELFNIIPKVSDFGDCPAEGIVIEKMKDHTRGKVVRAEFIKHIDENEHWTKYNIAKNELAK